MKTIESDLIQKKTSETRSYKPSFIDGLMNFIGHLPVPYWLTYILLFLLQGLLNNILSWIDGWLPAFKFTPLMFIYPLWLWIPLAIITHLNSVASEALSSFSPLLQLDEERLKRMKFEFTSIPARGAILSGVFWALSYVALMYFLLEGVRAAYGWDTWVNAITYVEGLVSYCIGSVIYYHSIRQLWLVKRTVELAGQFNLFRLDPVYAFSRVTAQTGIGWMIMLSLTLLTFPLQLTSFPVLVLLVLQVLLAITAFVFPLWFVHRRLVAEKRRLLAENHHRVGAILEQYHNHLDGNILAEANQLGPALAGLNTERAFLNAIPTWPWRTGTLTGFLSAIVLPIILFLVQLFIRKMLGV